MTILENSVKYKLESLFNMSSGYVLDFSNASFADFVHTSIGINPYETYGEGSKANLLRQIWLNESAQNAQKLSLELLYRWRTMRLLNDDYPTDSEERIYNEVHKSLTDLAIDDSAADVAFVEKDFASINLDKIDAPINLKQVVDQRLAEIDQCIKSKSSLAVVFLCGSTLEGLLYEVASKNRERYSRCSSSPKHKGKVKPLEEWSLNDLIVTSRELNVIGEDVVKHAHALKDFRNYIHPRQQIKENFSPRGFTASIARNVLLAAIADLSVKKQQRP